MTFAEMAKGHQQYFEHIVKDMGNSHFRPGIEFTREWGNLIARDASLHDAIRFFVRVNDAHVSHWLHATGWFAFRLDLLRWVDLTWKNAPQRPSEEEVILLANSFEAYFEAYQDYPEAVSLCRRWAELATAGSGELRQAILQEAKRLEFGTLGLAVGFVALLSDWVGSD